jgi:exodeoxyribonuclease VII small subunit
MNFEDANKRLQEIIVKLEEGSLSLDEATKLYEEGVKLSKECYKQLDSAKGKIVNLKEELNKYIEE